MPPVTEKDAVSARLNSDAGISYTEFSYQVLQGLDFLELYRTYGCVLQTGGSDQWGNLTSGTDLIRRAEGTGVHAIGTPLITNSDGTKFGKSEGNAIWLDDALTSPYAFYQFWLNTDDKDVISRLKVFTFLTKAEIERLEALVASEPFRREAQRTLAWEVTSLVHGAEATDAAINAAQAHSSSLRAVASQTCPAFTAVRATLLSACSLAVATDSTSRARVIHHGCQPRSKRNCGNTPSRTAAFIHTPTVAAPRRSASASAGPSPASVISVGNIHSISRVSGSHTQSMRCVEKERPPVASASALNQACCVRWQSARVTMVNLPVGGVGLNQKRRRIRRFRRRSWLGGATSG